MLRLLVQKRCDAASNADHAVANPPSGRASKTTRLVSHSMGPNDIPPVPSGPKLGGSDCCVAAPHGGVSCSTALPPDGQAVRTGVRTPLYVMFASLSAGRAGQPQPVGAVPSQLPFAKQLRVASPSCKTPVPVSHA